MVSVAQHIAAGQQLSRAPTRLKMVIGDPSPATTTAGQHIFDYVAQECAANARTAGFQASSAGLLHASTAVDTSRVAAEAGTGETTTAVPRRWQHEADDIAAAGGHRNAPGLEGKYFFRTQGQAEQYGQMMNKAPDFGAPNYLTSGSVPNSALGSAEGMEAGSEGPGPFFRGDPSDFFNVFNHGLIP